MMSKTITTLVTKISSEKSVVSVKDFVYNHLQRTDVSDDIVYFYIKDPLQVNFYVGVKHKLLFSIKKQLTDTEVHTLLMWEENVDDVVKFIEENLDE